MTPGLTSCSFRQLTIQQVVDLTAQSGLEVIEWAGDAHVRPDEPSTATVARKVTEAAGLQVSSFGTYYRASGEDFAPVLAAAVELGVPSLRIWAGNRGSAEIDQDDRAAVVRNIAEACRLSDAHGLVVSLEFHRGTLTDSLESTLRLVQEVDAPNLRLYWQPFPERSHETHLSELRAVLPWLSNLHIFHWKDEDGQTVRYPLSESATEWQELLAIPTSDRFALLEFVPHDNPDLLAQEAATLKGWLQSL